MKRIIIIIILLASLTAKSQVIKLDMPRQEKEYKVGSIIAKTGAVIMCTGVIGLYNTREVFKPKVYYLNYFDFMGTPTDFAAIYGHNEIIKDTKWSDRAVAFGGLASLIGCAIMLDSHNKYFKKIFISNDGIGIAIKIKHKSKIKIRD